MRQSQVYRRRNGLFVCAMSRARAGFWVAAKPFLGLAVDASRIEVGTAVAAALNASGSGVDNPPPTGPLPIQPLLEVAGVKSWATFVRGAQMVVVRLDDVEVFVEPNENRGGREGFVVRPDMEVFSAPVGDAEQVGKAVLDGLTVAGS